MVISILYYLSKYFLVSAITTGDKAKRAIKFGSAMRALTISAIIQTISNSMKIKEQTKKLAAGCSKHCFEVVDKTDEVSYIFLRQGEADVVLRDFRRVSKSKNNPQSTDRGFLFIIQELD